MKKQKTVWTVWIPAWICLAVCLAGCSASFGGAQPGGRRELVFSCQEGLSAPEGETEDMQAPVLEDGTETAELQVSGREDEGASSAEVREGNGSAAAKSGSSSAGDGTAPEAGAASRIASDGRVNINTAGMEELMTLNGIGETRARAIMEYRTKNGLFTKAEDIMQIPGIKEGIYSKIQDQIIVQ